MATTDSTTEKESLLTHAAIRSLLDYSPSTGEFTWRRHRKGTPAGTLVRQSGYKRIQIGKRSYKAHRIAWLYMTGHWPSGVIDHINGDRSDNRFFNLRDVSQTINMLNRNLEKGNSGKTYCGVERISTGRFSFCVTVAGVRNRHGYWDTAEEAYRASLQFRIYHGLPVNRTHIPPDLPAGPPLIPGKKRFESGVPGVSWRENKKLWRAYISYQGRQINLGHYKDINPAINARLKAERNMAEGLHPLAEAITTIKTDSGLMAAETDDTSPSQADALLIASAYQKG